MQHKRNDRYNTPWARLASVMASIVLVLSLIPIQGLAEARDEFLDLTNTASQEPQTTDGGNDPGGGTQGSADQNANAGTDDAASNQTTVPVEDVVVEEGGENGQPEQQMPEATTEQPTVQPEEQPKQEVSPEQAQSPQQPERKLSANLADFITKAELEGAEEKDGAFVVDEGTSYNVKLTFTEGIDGKEYAETGELTYALPAGFNAVGDQPAAKEPLVVTYVDDNGERQPIELAKESWWVSDNAIHLVWRVRDADKRSKEEVDQALKTIYAFTEMEFTLNVAGTFAKDARDVNFGRDIVLPVSVTPAKQDEAKKDEGKPEQKKDENKQDEEKPEEKDEEAEAKPEQKQAEETEATKTEYVYENDNLRVTATVAKASALPDAAKLRVTRVQQSDANHDAYLKALNNTAANSDEYNAQNTLLYDVKFELDGKEIQPAEGDVAVSFQFKNNQLADELDAQAKSHVEVTHLPMANGTPTAEQVDANVSVAKETASFTTTSFSVYAFSYTVDFTYGGYFFQMPGGDSVMLSNLFMSLGINRSMADVAKVEFSNPELVSVVQVDSNWRLTSLKSFVTPEKLTVTMTNGDKYEIDVTDPAVGTQGVSIGVQSEPTDLSDKVKSVSVSAPMENGKYKLMPGETYTITMSFAEEGDKQFPDDDTPMYYTVPNDFKLPTTEAKDFKIIVTDPEGKQFTVSGNKYRINENNQLEVWFNKDDPNFSKLTGSTNARISMSFDGEFDSNKTQVDFGNNVKIDVDLDNTSKVESSKSASLDLSSNPPKINYTATVTSTGHSTNVQVTDTISCKDQDGQDVSAVVLKLDPNSFKRQTNKGDQAYQDQTISVTTSGDNNNAFTYDIGSMKNGEIVTIKYSATIDPSAIPKIDGKTKVVIGNNEVSVKSYEQPTPSKTNINTRIDYSPKLQKDGMTLNQDGKSFTASYTFNGDKLVNGGGYTLTDTVGNYLTLDGTTGAKVTVYKDNGETEIRNLNWGEGGLQKTSDRVFTYEVPSTDTGNYKYVVEYEVKIDGTGQALNKPTTVSNTVQYDKDHESTGTGVITPSDDNKFEFNKRVNNIDYENKRVSWTTTINVPVGGLESAKATITDTLPGTWSKSYGWVQDDLYVIPGDDGTASPYHQSVKVTGLNSGESYTVTPHPGSSGNQSTFDVEFYKTGGEKGLDSAGVDGHARIVTVTYETTVNENWLADAANNSWLQNHTNSAKIENETETATADIAGVGVAKNSEIAGYRTVNGVKLPVYKYTLLLKNVTQDDNTIKDFFDTEILTPLAPDATGNYPSSMGTLSFSPDYFAWYTTNQNNGTRSTSPVSYMPISEQITEGGETKTQSGIAFTTDYDSMVRDTTSTTGYYPITKIMYYLTVKDEAALKKLQNRAVNNADGGEDDKTYTLTNKANWGASTDPGDVKYQFPGITKEMLNNSGQPMTQQDLTVQDGEIYANFKLTVNPGGGIINGGNPYDITDTIDHLSIDITSIQVSPTPETGEVVYDMKDNELKFENVPDGKEFVITYRARVIYDSIGNAGDTINVNFKNDVSMLGYEDHISDWAHRKNTGTGAADLYAIKLMKYQAGNMSQKLNGAEFTLYEAMPGDDSAINPDNPTGYVIDTSKPVKDGEGNIVTFTSGKTKKYGPDKGTSEEDGMVTVYGLQDQDGWALEPGKYYFLRETKAPANHKLPGYDFQFMISEDGITHYERYIYHSNDTMSAKNYPGKDIHIKKYWGNVIDSGQSSEDPTNRSYQPSDSDVVVVRLQQKIGDGEWRNTIRREVKGNPSDANEKPHWADVNENDYPMGNVYSPLIELNKSNGWEADFTDLPLAVPTGDGFTGEDVQVDYQVLEWTINGKPANQGTVQQNGFNDEYTWSYQPQGKDMSITNVPKNGSLKLRKRVQVNGSTTTGTLADGWYNFTIKGVDATSSISKSVTVEVENGAMKQAIVDGDNDHPLTPGTDGYIEISDFKIGNYTVTEEAPSNGTSLVDDNGKTVTVDGKTGTAVLSTGMASFTNNIDLGGLKIKKVVAENSDDSVSSRRAKDKLAGTYYFNVYTEQACTNLARTIDGKDAQLSITIGADGQAVTSDEIQNLKAGDYWVRETLPDGSVTTPVANPVKVTVEAGKTGQTAVISTLINKYDTGSLKIKKNVTVNGVPAAQTNSKAKTDGTYTFQIWKGDYKGESIQRARVKITFKDGVATSAQYEWTDERTGDEGKTPVWKTDDITVANGVVTLKGLEPGTYTVHEIENKLPTGMELVNGHGQGGNDQQVTVTAGDTATIQTAEFTNDYEELGGLELKKSIITQSPIAAENVQFNFTITVYKDNPVGKSDAELAALIDKSIEGNYGQITFHGGVATNVKLVGNETLTANNLPTGRYFKIVEDSAVGWSLTGITVNDASQTTSGAATGIISTTESKVEFKNELDEGNLKIEKEVDSKYDQDKSKEFKFKVVLDGYALTGIYGTGDTAMSFTNGAAEFTLKDGQYKEAVKLPANIKYTVTETNEEGFVTTWSGDTGGTNPASGTITKGTSKTVAAKNTREYGDLEIDKIVLPASRQASGDEFTFTVSLSDKTINGKFDAVSPSHKSIEFTSGVGQVTLKHGEKASVKDLPAGITYTVTEAKAEGFTLSGVTGNMGKIIAHTAAKAEFTNQYDNGGLVIAKNVTSATSTDDNLYFPFKVTITLPAGGTHTGLNGKVTDGDDISYTSGVAYVFLKKGQQAVSNGLGVDYGYQVQELDISDASVKAEVENHLTDGITIDQVADLSRYSTVIQDGSNKIVNPNGGTIASGKISAATSSARYTNTHVTGPLTLSKKLISDAAADRNKEFKFEVKILKAAGGEVDTSINGVFGGMTFTQGVATVTVKGNGSVQATGLPVGLAFEITETSMPDNFTMKGYVIDGADGTGETAQNNITRDGRTVEFTNERATGPLTLSKELISGRAADANQNFTFTVRLSDTSISKEYTATYTPAKDPAETKVKFTQGVATISLKGSQSVKIDGLPTEVNYSVSEAGTPGFRMTGVTKSENGGTAAAVTGAVEGVIVNGSGDEITYQNTRTPGELTVSKKLISDLPADATKPFTFTVAFEGLSDSAKSAEYDIVYANPSVDTNKITLSNGSATVELIGGQTATIKGLPTDVTYTVTEASVADFKITGVTGNGADVTTDNVVNGKTGTIATTPASVEVTNTRETGKLTVSKKLFSQKSADANKLYTFTVKLGHLEGEVGSETFDTDDIDKAFSGVTFTDGVGTFTLKAGQSKTIDGLPRGIRYEVTEAEDADTVLSGVANNGNESNLETTRTQADGAISAIESKALFKNTGKRGGLQGSKTVVGPTAPDQEFTFTLRLAGAAAVNGEGFTDSGTTYSYGRYYANAENTTGTAISFKNGAATFKIKNGGSFKLENLPLGTRYTLTETSANGFATTVTNGTEVPGETYKDAQDVEHTAQPGEWYKNTDKGKVTGVTYVGEVKEGTGTETITYEGPAFENTHEEGSLRIHKVVNSNYETDKDVSYTFRVELSDKSITAVQGDSPTAYITGSGYGKVNGNDNIIPFNNGVATFTLGDKGYASITGLPAGTTYTVTETSVEGIETTWTDVVSTDNGANVATKRVGTEGKGTIAANEVATTTATNTRMLGKLDIAKTVISHSADDKNTEYTFKVSFYSDKDLQAPTSVRVKYKTNDYSAELNASSAEFRLSDGEVAHFTELPQGIYYEVEETGKYVNDQKVPIDEGMTTSTKLGQGRLDSGKIDKVTTSRFTNTRIEGGLFVYKNVSSHIDSDKQKEFDFRVTLYKEDPAGKTDGELANLIDTSVNGVYGTGENAMNFVGGVATFKLKDGEFRYAMNLKTGLYFRAMEVNDPNFNVATSGTKVEQGVITYKDNNQDKQWGPSTGEQGQIPNSGNATARITNSRKAGNLEVIKSREGEEGSAGDEFFFTVELSDKSINGTFGEGNTAMTFNNGVATFSLKKGDSKSTVEHEGEGTNRHEVGTLPIGIRYRVTERNADGYLTSWESVTYANDTDGPNDTPTKYSYQYNQTWNDGNVIEGLPYYDEGSETRTITWGGTHTSTAVNTAFSKPTGETGTEDEYDGSAHSWTLGDHATEWGWRETDETGKVKEDSTLQISGITENDGKPNTDTVTFKNDRQKASIVLYKEVTSGLLSDSNKTFRFHLQLLDSVPASTTYNAAFYKQKVTTSDDTESISYDFSKNDTVSFDGNGMGAVSGASAEGFDLKAGDIIVISGLPLGTRYKVTEDADSDFDSSNMDDSGRAGYALAGEKLLVADELRSRLPDVRARSGYNNIRKMGELEVRKTVDSDLQSDKDASYTFTIKLNDESYNSVFSMARAVAQQDNFDQDMYYSKTNPDEVLITGYDENEYKEDEDGNREYKPIYDTVNGVRHYSYQVSENDLVQFTDGSATIQLKDGEFAHFYVDNVTGDDAWKPAQGEIALIPYDSANKNYYNFGGLPRGVGYTVTETENNGLTTSWAGTTTEDGKSATGTISSSALAVADCTNTREGGNLTVSKELISEAAADKSKVFDFTVRLYSDEQHTKPLALSGKYGDITFSNGVAAVQILGGNSATATGLPNETYYTVTEASATGFTLEGVAVNGTNNKEKEYSSTTTDDEGHQTTTTEAGGEGQILSTTPSTVVFTNKRVTGPIRITKELFSTATADQNKEFLIVVRLDDASINTEADDGVHGKVADGDQQLVFTNGIANVRLKSGEYASITNLPTGVKYSVNEENAAGYEAIQAKMVNGVEQETTGGDDISALAVVMHEIEPEGSDNRVVIKENNTRNLGAFIINKSFAPTGETGGDEKFVFEVQLYSTYVAEGDPANVKETGITTDPNAPDDANPPRKFGDLVFDEGKATVELSKDNNWRAEAKNIPTGLYYTVKEVMTDDQKENFRLVNGVGEIQSGQVINGATLVSFTNERVYKGDLAVRKELAYPDLDEDKDQEFTFKVTLYNDWTKATVAEDINKTYATISPTDKPLEFKNGVATVSLKHDERASASKLPEGMAYEVEELSNNALQGFAASTKYELYDGGTGTEDSKQVITKDRLAQATVTNTREVTNASITKAWDETGNTHADAKSMVPDSIAVNLMRDDNATEPYLTVTLNKENNWTATPDTVTELGKLPLKDYNGNSYTYTWKEPSVPGWTLASTTYSQNGTPVQDQNVTNVAGYLTTLTNTVDTGSIKVTKHFAKIDPGTLTADDLKQITFSVKNAEDTQVATNTLDQFARENDGLAWTIEGLPIGTYTVTETNAHKKYSFETTYKVGEGTATTTPAEPKVIKGQTTAVDVTNTYIPDKPGFDKKIQDINDTTGQTSDWQDSADYDIGDSVPYRLTATLAKDVTAYKQYRITFTDKMEESLDYNKGALITVTGADGKVIDPSTYIVEKVAENAHDFAYKLTWGDGKALISNENLNNAKVEVRFTATLNSKAKLGKEGNVNACKLAYSNNPTSEDDKDEGELPWDYVIAFTYKLDVNKVDADANALEGAKFKLEKKLSNDTLQEIALTNTKNVFTAIGVDDGTYILTETEAPSGYDLIDPIEFTVTADHNVTWDYTSDPSADPKFDGTGRTNILSALTGKTETGELELKADEQLQGLAGNVVNKVKTPATIAVRKVVSSSRSEDKTKSFGFKVTLYKDQKRTKVADDLTGTYGDMEFKNGVATFNLKDNQTKTAKDLPLYDNGELGYKVEETNSGGLTSNLKETKGKDGVSTTITCTNTYTASKSGSSTTSSDSSTGGSLATTGDTTNNAGVVALLATGALGILAGALYRRRRQQQ